MSRKWNPNLLNIFLYHIVCSDIKKVTLGQSIVQAVRPMTVIAPVMLGVGVFIDHLFGGKTLIDLLYRLGISIVDHNVCT